MVSPAPIPDRRGSASHATPTPVNKRRDLLALDRDMMLEIGTIPAPPGVVSRRPCPEPGSEEWQALRACWEAHRDRYGESTWGYLAFELDVEAALRAKALVPVR
jgi:hypothetical protein